MLSCLDPAIPVGITIFVYIVIAENCIYDGGDGGCDCDVVC
jgi:hypothetical protein